MLELISAPPCKTRVAVIEAVEEWKRDGYGTPTRRYEFRASQVGPGPDVSIHLIDLLGTDNASRIIDNSGATVQDLPEEKSDIRVTVMRFGDAERVEEAAAIKR